ncbi:MAG: tRNA pseudouridine(55) synthase TruB [Anaerofustis sp.]
MDGFLLINKPVGCTSHDICHRLKKILHTDKIGHTGTLDPMAQGLLLVMVGSASRLSEYLVLDDKEYVATVRFGIRTDTQDTTGTVLERKEPDIRRADLLSVLSRFEGRQKQIPPMYSAIKHKGKHLYDYARKGEQVELSAREIHIYEAELLSDRLPFEADIRVFCSKGTYIRTLCNDIGEALGCHAAMSALTRTKIGGYSLDEAFAVEEIEQKMAKDGTLFGVLKLPDDPLNHLPRVDVIEDSKRFLLGGNELLAHNLQTDTSEFISGDTVRIYAGDQFLAIGTVTESRSIKPRKVMVRQQNK